MSLFRRREQPVEQRGFTWPGYPHGPSTFAAANPSGVPVTLETYTRSAASWACVRVLVSTVKKLPIDVVRYEAGTRRPIERQPQIVRAPSATVSRRGFVAQWMRSFCSAGNVYGHVTGVDNAGRPASIEIINPAEVSWQSRDGRWVPCLNGVAQDVWPMGVFWHRPATDFLVPGRPFAMSPVEQAAVSIGTGIAAEQFGAQFFGDGAHPTQLLKTDQSELTPEQAEAAKQKLINATRGTREPLVLGSGWELEKLQVDPKDSQFIDLLRFEVEQACRWWGVPPSMVYAAVSGQSVTYSNVSQADLSFLKHSVDNWLVDIEDAWSEFLAPPEVVKFNTSALLRMDDEARWKVHDTRLRNKTTSINEVRTIEDELPFPEPEYDTPGIPGEDTRRLSIAEAVQKVYLGVGKVITPDEAREIVNQAGGALAIPGPDLGDQAAAPSGGNQ